MKTYSKFNSSKSAIIATSLAKAHLCLLSYLLYFFSTYCVCAGEWQRHDVNTFTDFGSIIWDGSKYIIVGGGGTILTSDDAVTWNSTPPVTPAALFQITKGRKGYVAIGEKVGQGGGVILRSNDGYEWSFVRDAPLIAGLAWGKGKFVVGGTVAKGLIMSSADGFQWSKTRLSRFAFLTEVEYSPLKRRFVALSLGNRIFYSNSLSVWASTRIDYTLRDVAWGGSQFVAVGASGATVSSRNGVTWNYSYVGSAHDLESVAWSGERFLAVGWTFTGYTLRESIDGIHWTEAFSGPNPGIPRAVCWGNGKFIVVGDNGFVGTYVP